MESADMTFDRLAGHIELVDDTLRQQAAHAVNCMLTARNWLIGCYILEYEQKGADRAQYGEQLLKTLAQRINRKGMIQSLTSQSTTHEANKLRSLPAIFHNAEPLNNASSAFY